MPLSMPRRHLPTTASTSAAALICLLLAPSALAQEPELVLDDVFYDTVLPDGTLAGGRTQILVPDRSQLVDVIPAAAMTLTNSLGPVNPANRVDIVYVGDGYTAAEIAAYVTHVDAIQPTFFNKEPFDTYENYFTVHRVDVVSNESGVDNDPNQGVERDTAMDMQYWCNGTERLLCVSVFKATSFANNAPDVDQIVAIANSSKYGGAGYSSSNLGTAAATNGAAIEIVLHELGHSFGNLADEYTYGGRQTYQGGEPGSANLSILNSTQMANQMAKWFRWLGVNDPQFDGLVGTYEGGGYSEQGIYRPTNNSLMRNLGRPFSRPNLESMVIEIYRIVSPIDGSSSTATTYLGNEVLFVTPMQPIGSTLDVQWSLDGVDIPGATGTTLDLSTLNLTACNQNVSVTVTDNTAWVRDENLRAQYMTDSRTFGLLVGNGGWENYCTATPNSTGNPALMGAFGSNIPDDDDFNIFAGPIPAGGLGIFFVGENATQSPFGNGFLCVQPPVVRLGVAQASPIGFADKVIHPGNLGFEPFDQSRFQYWYRNPAGGGAQFNLSDGLLVSWCE
jgi:hypothetical protein